MGTAESKNIDKPKIIKVRKIIKKESHPIEISDKQSKYEMYQHQLNQCTQQGLNKYDKYDKYNKYNKPIMNNNMQSNSIVYGSSYRESTPIHNGTMHNGTMHNNIIEFDKIPNINNLINYDFENKTLDLSYENINDTVLKYKKQNEDEKESFNRYMEKKNKYIQSQINIFESKYDPYKILNISKDNISLDIIRKAYKKKALQYHPDRVSQNDSKLSTEYNNKFKIITQAYLYLLKKYEEDNQLEIKINKPVEKSNYEDNINEGVENKYIDKDNFNIDRFNEIFEEYKIPDTYEDGYNNLINETGKRSERSTTYSPDIPIENNIFSNNFNLDIFNKSFDNYKQNKPIDQSKIIEYYEPEAMESSAIGFQELGVIKNNNFENINKSRKISYTDYKTAHIDANVLITNKKDIGYQKYKDINQLEQERSNISYKLTPEEREKKILYEQQMNDKESKRIAHLAYLDSKINKNYNKINKLRLK